MTCAYCDQPAVAIDLCHAGHPVCAAHPTPFGHQLAPLPEPEPRRRTVKAETATAKAEADAPS
jgi:hypothetical protein